MIKLNTMWLAVVLMCVMSIPAWAAPQTWNGPSGSIWDNGTTTSWAGPAVWVNGNDATFGTNGAGSVVIDGISGVTANSLTFSGNGYVVSGGTLTLSSAAGTITTSGARTPLISSIIGGAGTSLTYESDNTSAFVTLTGANTYTGDTIVSGQGHVNYGGNPSLVLSNTTGSAIQSSKLYLGRVSNSGHSVVSCRADNQFSTNTVLYFNMSNFNMLNLWLTSQTVGGLMNFNGSNGGYPVIQITEESGAPGSGTGLLTVDTAPGTSYTWAGILRNLGGGRVSLVKTGTGTQTLAGTLSSTGVVDVRQGTLVVSNPAALSFAAITNNDTLVFVKDSGVQAYAGALAGTGTVVKAGAGTLTLSGSCPFSGTVAVGQGTFGLSGVACNGSVTVTNGASLIGNGSYGGTVTLLNGALLSPGGSGTVATITCGDLAVGNGTNQFDVSNTSGDKIIATNSVTAAGGVIAINVSGILSNGTYTLITYSNSFTGSFAPTLLHGAARGTFTLVTNIPNVIALSITNAGTGDLVWSSAVNTNWDVSTSANWLLGASRDMFFQGDGVTFDNSGVVSNQINLVGTVQPRSVMVNSSGNYTFGGAGTLGGNATLTKAGSGTLTLASANAFAGTTTISNGVIVLAHAAGLNGSTLDYNSYGGTLSFGTQTSATFGGLQGGQSLALANASAVPVALTLGANSTTYSGVPSGDGTLSLAGSGTLTLINTNTYTGDTVVSGQGHAGYGGSPSLILSNAAAPAIQSAKVYLGRVDNPGSAVVNFYANNQFSSNAVIYFSGSAYNMLNLRGSTQTVAGVQTFNGSNPGYATIENSEGEVNAAWRAVLNINTPTNTSYALYGIIRNDSAGTVSIVKMGPGTQHLGGNSIGHSGPTVVKEGRLEVESLSASATVDIQGGAFAVARTGAGNVQTAITTLTGAGTYEVNMAQNSDILDPFWTATAKTITMQTNSLFLVTRGTVRLGFGYNIDWSGNKAGLTVNSGAAFDMNSSTDVRFDALNGGGLVTGTAGNDTLTVGSAGGSGAFSGVITQGVGYATGLIKVGSGTQTLSGTNSYYTGATTVNAGTLILDGINAGTGTVSVSSGAMLAGTGTVAGAISVGTDGVLAPGEPSSWAGLGRLSVSNVTFASNATFRVRIVKTGCDVLSAGAVSLGNAVLDIVSTNEYISSGTEYVIINAASIASPFVRYPEGAVVSSGANKFAVQYVGGTNVVLKAISAGTMLMVQ